MRELKIAMIGAGSTYSPELIHGFLIRQELLRVKEFYLMDIDMERLRIVGGLIKRMCENFQNAPVIHMSDNLEEAISGADYVVSQFRVGLLPARAKDERIPKDHGYIGQETTGFGGFANAMRTIPESLKIARCIMDNAKNAMLINFTNPSGIITEAITKYSDVNVVGLCNSPITTFKKINSLLNLDEKTTFYDYFGLNHLGFIRDIFVNGKSMKDELFPRILNHEKMPDMLGYRYNKRQALAMGILPMAYVQYYFHELEKTRELTSQLKTRGELLIDVDKELLKQYDDPQLKTKPPGLDQRGGAWYSEAAVALINSIENCDGQIHVINTVNNGTITDLPDDAVIEIPAIVNGRNIRALQFGKLPLAVKGLVQHVKAYESLTVEAAATRSKEKAFLAICSHPYSRSSDDTEKIFEEYLVAHQKYLDLV